MVRHSLLAALLSLSTIPSPAAQPQPPTASRRAQCKFEDHTDVTIEYGSMRKNGRKIFDGLVPYGKTWQMGEKQSPTLVATANLVLGGTDVKAGQYSLSAIPNPGTWTMIVKPIPGKPSQSQTDELTRIDLTVRPLPSPLENFTIAFDQFRGGCVLNLRWEKTEASVLLAEKN